MNSWSISELKERGRAAKSRAYWRCVLCALILNLISEIGGSLGGFRGSSFDASGFEHSSDMFSYGGPSFFGIFPPMSVFVAFTGIMIAVIWVAAIVLQIFILEPLEVGAQRFFIVNRVQDAELGEIGAAFRANGYLNVVKTQFLRYLYTFLWTLLFVIPGIVKSYEYRMIPYILAENPEIDTREAFRLSRNMMMGEKWNAFVLDLSFIGWHILSAFTCGILDVFYTNPYQACTNAELYDTLKSRMFGSSWGGSNSYTYTDNTQNTSYNQGF